MHDFLKNLLYTKIRPTESTDTKEESVKIVNLMTPGQRGFFGTEAFLYKLYIENGIFHLLFFSTLGTDQTN